MPVIKIDKRKKTMSKKIDNDIMLADCNMIINFPIYGQFEAIWKPDFGRIVC